MKPLICSLLLTAFMLPAYADTQTENTELARINSVLNAVYPLITAAQKAARKNTRTHFRYDWLARDIARIQAGIAQKINHAPLVPTAVTPLQPHFVQAQNARRDTNASRNR